MTRLGAKEGDKPKLLISWGNPYQLQGQIFPFLAELCETFAVYIVCNDCSLSSFLRVTMEDLRTAGRVKDFWFLPDFSKTFSLSDLMRYHGYIRKNLKFWKEIGFDLLLAQGDHASFQRYLSRAVVPGKCPHVCWIEGRTHLLIYKEFCEALMAGREPAAAVKGVSREYRKPLPVSLRMKGVLKEDGLRTLLRKSARWCGRRLGGGKRRWIGFLDRHVIPLVLVGKRFPRGPYDFWTQMGPGDCDLMLFSDPVVAKAHITLLKTSNIGMVRYPTEGLCRCGKEAKKNGAVLVGVGHGHEIGEKHFPLYERDLRTVLLKTGASEIHLRFHPRANRKGAEILARKLNVRGLKTLIVGNKKPIYEVVCDYLAVAGPLSESLRDARVTCDTIPVIGLVAVSDPRYEDPKFSFGDWGMLGWIEADGSFEPEAFSGRRAEGTMLPSVPEVLKSLHEDRTSSSHAGVAPFAKLQLPISS